MTLSIVEQSSLLSSDDIEVFGCDTWPLHYACRVGNLDHVKFLVNVRKYPVNQMDSHDASPLYLAALCGHNEICQFLLERGAKCDPNGDAARVFYVALTPELRNLLKEWSLTAASRDPWLESMSRAFQEGLHSDCSIHVAGRKVGLHRVVLGIRCPKLMMCMLRSAEENNDWDSIVLPTDFPSDESMLSVLEYLYTGIFETRDLSIFTSILHLTEQLGLETLCKRLQGSIDSIGETHPFRCEVNLIDEFRSDMRRLAAFVGTPHAEVDSLSALARLVEQTDATLQCHDCTWSLNKFRLVGSEYFDCALSGGFMEAQSSHLDLTHMVMSPDPVRLLIQWLYCDEFLEAASVETAVEVMELGFALICPRLPAYVANTILIPAVDEHNAIDLLKLARIHELERLEERCAQEIACNLLTFAESDELLSILQEESALIKQGGDERMIDVPLAAEFRRAIKKEFSEESDTKAEYLARLQDLLDMVLHTAQ